MSFRLTPSAEADLAEIIDYVTEAGSADRAEALLRDFVAAAGKLADMPRMGHTRRDLTDENLRFWPVFSYLIAYRPEIQPLQIVRVIHGSRHPSGIEAAVRDGSRPG